MPIKILAISGSLRKASFNTALLNQIARHLDDRAEVEFADIGAIPHYDGDLDVGDGPEAVQRFKAQVAAAHAVIIATPEYNYSIPGVLKNAIDWASRPAFKSVFAGKKVGVCSASMAGTAGVRAQMHLKTVLLGVLADVVAMPDVSVAAAHTVVAEDGTISDPSTLKYIGRLADKLIED